MRVCVSFMRVRLLLQVISILCRAVLENRTDMFGKPAQTYKSDLLQLLGRLTAKVTPDGDTWCMYARLLLSGEERNTPENVDRVSCSAYVAADIEDVDRVTVSWDSSLCVGPLSAR